MQCIVARLYVKPDCCEEYEAEFAKAAKIVQENEQGCLLYQLAKHQKKKGQYYVLEVYSSSDAVKTHMKNLRKNRNPAMAKLMDTTKKPDISIMPVVGSPGLKLGTPTIAVLADIPAKDMDGLQKATLPALNDVHSKEPGNLMYCLGRNDKSKKFTFLELYTDMAAIGKHGKTPYFKAMVTRQKPFLGGTMGVELLKICGDGGIKPTQKL